MSDISNGTVQLYRTAVQLYSCTFSLARTPLRAVCLRVSRGTLEKRPGNATPLVATRQDVPLGPILEGALYGWWYGYAYTSVSCALLHAF